MPGKIFHRRELNASRHAQILLTNHRSWFLRHLQFLLVLRFVALCVTQLHAQDDDRFIRPTRDAHEQTWIDQRLAEMTEEEKIGQLLMIRAHSDRGPDFERSVLDAIKKYRVGGVLFFQGTALRQAELTNEYQAASVKTPLMVAMDAEWGLGMRLSSSTISFPRALTLGAITDNQWIFRMGQEIGRQCRRLGVHVNFAPVIDVNNNRNNPVINDRSFGEDPANVSDKGWAYAQGLQSQLVLACGKHFPGHGDTAVDSHHDLPVIPHDRLRLNALELVPFRKLFERGLGSVMVAHLNVPALDQRPNRPSTLSNLIVDGLLRSELDYQGLVFTDALEMKGVTKYFQPGEAEVEAFLAGNDVLLLPDSVEPAVRALQSAIQAGKISQDRLDSSVRRILRTKYRLGLDQPQRVLLENLAEDLNPPEASQLRRSLLQQALVLVRDLQQAIPVGKDIPKRVATLAIGTTEPTAFQSTCSQIRATEHFQVLRDAEDADWAKIAQATQDVGLLLVSFHGLNRNPRDSFGISVADVRRVRRLAGSRPVAVVHFGNPYGLIQYDGLPTLVQAFEESVEAQEIAAQKILSNGLFFGTLPITASDEANFGQGEVGRP